MQPGHVLGFGDTAVNRTHTIPTLVDDKLDTKPKITNKQIDSCPVLRWSKVQGSLGAQSLLTQLFAGVGGEKVEPERLPGKCTTCTELWGIWGNPQSVLFTVWHGIGFQ